MKLYGVSRPQAVWAVLWDGDNMQEIKDAFGPDIGPYFFVNEENGNLCYGANIEACNQYPIGTLMTMLGGVAGISQEDWDAAYFIVDSATRLKYDVTEDAETVSAKASSTRS